METIRIPRRSWPALALAVVAFLFLVPVVRVYQPTLDAGTYLDGAVRILGGQLPYRDFIEPAGPGSFYWIALWFRVFGASFATARTLLLLTGTALVLLTFVLSRRLGGNGYCAAAFVLATSVPVMVMNSPHYDSNLLILLAVLGFLSGRYTAAGLCLGLADLCMQGKGLYIVAGFGLYLVWRQEWKQVARIFCSWAIPLALGAAWFLYKHAIPDALYSTVWWPLNSYAAANQAAYAYPLGEYLHRWWTLFLPHGRLFASAMVLLWSTPCFLVATLPVTAPVGAYFARKWRVAHAPVWIAGFALFASEMHRRDLGHLMNAAPLLLILLCTSLEGAVSLWPRILASFVGFSLALYLSVQLFTASTETGFSSGRRGTLVGAQGSAVLQFLSEHTVPDEPVFVYPYRPVFYFWAGVRNPTRFTLLMYGYNTEEQFREAVRSVDQCHVRYVLWDEDFGPRDSHMVFPMYRQPSPDKQIMERYLQARYHRISRIEGFSIMQRNP